MDASQHGVNHMKALAACMKEQGKYAVYVGSLTVPLHITWSDSAINYQKQHYPNMQLVGDKFGVGESLDDSVRTTNDLMAKYPDLKGVLAFGSQGRSAPDARCSTAEKQRYLRHRAVQPGPGRFAGQPWRHQGWLYLESAGGGRSVRAHRRHDA